MKSTIKFLSGIALIAVIIFSMAACDDGSGGTGNGTETNPFSLKAGTWANGSIAWDYVWYSFNVTSGNTYYVWWNDDYDGDGSKTTDILVDAYYSNGSTIFEEEDSAWITPQSFRANSSGMVKLRVKIYSKSNSGTFAITYSTSSTRPGSSSGGGGNSSSAIDLPPNSWYNNTISNGATQTYRFYGNSGHTCWIRWDDSDNSNYTADIKVGLKREGYSSYVVEVDDRSYDDNQINYYFSTSGYYIIEVQAYSSSGGNYRIGYSQ